MEYMIKTYTNPGDVVLDNCMGSGTTGVACVNTGRNFIGMEKDPAYFKIAKERLEASMPSTAGVGNDFVLTADETVYSLEQLFG